MKKLLLATAVAAMSVSAAQAAPTLYGKVFLTTDYQDMSGDLDTYNAATGKKIAHKKVDDNNTSLNSDTSRIGLRGGEPLTANTDLVYQLEYRVEVDDGSKSQFTSRDTYLGLSNKQYGTLLAGRLSALDDSIDYATVVAGGIIGGDDVLATFNEPRANNAFAYLSPSYNGTQFMAMYSIDSDNDNNNGVIDHEIYGAGLKYEPTNQPLKAGITYITAGDALKALRVSGAYDVAPNFTLAGLYQNTDFDRSKKENAYTISGIYKTATPWSVYGQFDAVTNAAGYNDSDKQRYAIGGRYAFNANATGHIYGAYMNNDKVRSDDYKLVGVGTDTLKFQNAYDVLDSDGFNIGAGIEYKF